MFLQSALQTRFARQKKTGKRGGDAGTGKKGYAGMDDTEQKAAINYELLVEDALRTVVRGSLALVEHEGLPGESHFYITFQTTAEGV